MGSKKKKITVGYKYFFSIQSGLGRGPINELVAITADDKTVFAGRANEVTVSKSIYINKPNLFGGTNVGGEGGIKGIFEIAMGDADQEPTSRVKNLLGGVVPGFRGMVTTFFDGLISAYSASPKPWKYRVRRTTQGWSNNNVWYPEKCIIMLYDDKSTINEKDNGINSNLRTIHAMNPAHILIECATDNDWGRGLQLYEDIDLDSFKTAADILYNEKFGLCFRYNRQDGLDTFVQQVLDHIGAVQYADLTTGKIKLKLIRDNYKTEDLPLFNYDNGILVVQDDDSSASDNVPNEVAVKWHNPVTNEDSEVRAQNLGAIQAVGLISSSIEYKALPTFELAARVAQRELESGIAGLIRLTIQFDRRGEILTPADCFRISLPDRDIKDMVMRVGSINEHEDGMIEITAIQDVFGLADTVYNSGNQSGTGIVQDITPTPVENYMLFESPYFAMSQLSNYDVNNESGYMLLVSAQPNSQSINYLLQTTTEGADFTIRGTGDFTPSALLISKHQLSKIDTQLNVIFNKDMTDVSIGSAAIIDNEIVRIDAFDELNGTLTIARGCADTLPQTHNKDSFIWFFDSLFETDGIEYLKGEVVYVQQLTQTNAETLSTNKAPIRALKFDARAARPYPPANLQVNGVITETISLKEQETIVLTWLHRNKEIQQDNLIAYNEGNIDKPETVEYHIEYYLAGELKKTVVTNENSHELEINETEHYDEIRIYAYDTISELESLQKYKLQIKA